MRWLASAILAHDEAAQSALQRGGYECAQRIQKRVLSLCEALVALSEMNEARSP